MQNQGIAILLVEDDPDDVWMMRNLLSDRWDAPFTLVEVGLLAAANERCRDEHFDVILLDLSLPDSQGMETFSAMYAHAAGVPIVILSSYGDETTAVKAVQAGAQDYLVKGEVTDHILIRSIRYAIERSRRHRQQELQRSASLESCAAQEIQHRLYPDQPPALPGFDIAGALYPAADSAADYFDYIPMLDGRLAVVVGDVSSHGMGPALVMSATRACLRTLAQAYNDVGEILTRANRMLAADKNDFHFVTLAMAQIDPRSQSLVYASAGQRGYVLHPGINATILDSTSLPLSVCANTVVPATTPLRLCPGDLFTFFTDGVITAESQTHERFGVARVLQAIRSRREASARQIIDSLYQDISAFCGNQPLRDDITIVVVKVLDAQ